MKIDNTDQIIKNGYPEDIARSRSAGEKEFGAILKEAVDKAPQTEAGPRHTVSINPLAVARQTAPGPADPTISIERIEHMIDLLDQYRQKLADSRISLKQIDATIRKIARENENLATLADSLPDDDQMNDILNQTRVIASLEVAKFYRGDYLPA